MVEHSGHIYPPVVAGSDAGQCRWISMDTERKRGWRLGIGGSQEESAARLDSVPLGPRLSRVSWVRVTLSLQSLSMHDAPPSRPARMGRDTGQ